MLIGVGGGGGGRSEGWSEIDRKKGDAILHVLEPTCVLPNTPLLDYYELKARLLGHTLMVFLNDSLCYNKLYLQLLIWLLDDVVYLA